MIRVSTVSIREIGSHRMSKTLSDNDKELAPFAIGNHLASWAYTLSKQQIKGTLPRNIRVKKENNQEHCYQVIPLLPLLTKGMYGYLLLPHDPTEEIIVTFRGTEFKEFQSLSINFESGGPATESYFQIEQRCFQFVMSRIEEYDKYHKKTSPNLTLQVCGHSQGGVLAQLFCATFLKKHAELSNLDMVKELRMMVFNSPGIPKYIAHDATNHFLKKPLKCIAHFGMVGGDLIQTFGYEMLFAQKEFLAHIVANLLKVDKGLEKIWCKQYGLGFFSWFPKGILEAHSGLRFLLNNEGQLYPCAFYTNQNPEDVKPMLAELTNKTRIQYLSYVTPIVSAIREYMIFYYFGMPVHDTVKLIENLLPQTWENIFKTSEHLTWAKTILQKYLPFSQIQFKIDSSGALYPKKPLPVPDEWNWTNPLSWWYGKNPAPTQATAVGIPKTPEMLRRHSKFKVI